MESGSELSKTVATFILQKILLDETGLYYICQTYDRFDTAKGSEEVVYSLSVHFKIFSRCNDSREDGDPTEQETEPEASEARRK